MAGYMVYWPQDILQKWTKAGEHGPIRVVYGSIHSRMPTIASIKVGDVVFPVSQMKNHLYVMARLPVTHREAALDYTLRELGSSCGALGQENSPGFDSRTRWQPILDHQPHQMPFNCCSQWAVWGEEGSSIEPRQIPDEVLPELRFGPSKAKERPLKFTPKGGVLSSSLTATRRMSEETFAVFEGLF